MSELGADVFSASGHGGPGMKLYEPPVLEILDSDNTATGSDGSTSDGSITTSATTAGS